MGAGRPVSLNGCDRPGTGIWATAVFALFSESRRDRSHLHGTHPREGRTPARLGLAADRGPRFERHPSSPGDLCAPEPAARGCGRTGPAASVARRRSHLHGGLARPTVRRLCRHRTRMGDGGGPPSVAPQDRRRALPGETLVRPGEAPRRSGQARDGCKAGRAGDALVRQAGARTRPGRTEPIRRTVHWRLRPAFPPLR